MHILLLPLFAIFTSAYSSISDDTLRSIPRPGSDFDIHTGALLSPILVPRIPGSEGSRAVLSHFANFFRTNLPEWRLEFQNSTAMTPVDGGKEFPFVNLIATRDPPWADVGDVGRLTLVAHYDSKYHPEGFIGATDSAAPCAMLLHAARSIDAALTAKWADMEASGEADELFGEHKGVQILLLDGEEAFNLWSDTDSVYGARSLAEYWDSTFHPALSTYKTPLNSISLFVLLDLLGAKSPTVPSYFKTTHWAYKNMANLESRLRNLDLFRSSSLAKGVLWLSQASKPDSAFSPSRIGDDHVPFMQRGVEILHVIPSPFPRVWHRMEDDGEHLDMDTVEDWAVLVTAFVAEWMELDGLVSAASAGPAAEKLRIRDEL